MAGGGVGEMAMKPPAVCWVTVRLPEIAWVPMGMPQWPSTGRIRAVLALNVPCRVERKVPGRVSMIRLGFMGTKRRPPVPGSNQPVTSSTTWVRAPVVPLNTIDSLPVPSSGANTPLARLSAIGKLSVDVAGLAVGVLVTARKPPDVCWVTVRLPVMAVAVAGMPLALAIWSVRGVLLTNWPESPVPIRLSRTRFGARVWNVAPLLSARK
jgi:hypothetical protein